MAKKALLFPTSVVGSLPRPQFVREMIWQDADPFSATMDKAVRYAIALQEQAGLDIISDGEWRRKSYVWVLTQQVIGGFQYFFDKQSGQPLHIVVGKLQVNKPGFFAREAVFLKQNSSKKIKVAVPSPYLLGQRMWDEERSARAYKTRREFMEALVPILNKEILLLRHAGADVIQIDDPHICMFVDKKTRARFKSPDEELKYACVLVNEVIKGVKGVETALHLCRRNRAFLYRQNRSRRGWVGEGGYEPIIPFIQDLKVNQFVLEYSIPVAGDLRALALIPKRFKIGLGCVECRFEHIDTPKEITARVEQALQYVAPERILLNPDCGFAPRLQTAIPVDEAYLKLKNEVEAAKILREKYV
ncbi:MAG: cobalamin-independent methionine synthase II family protein [Candidatus Doudnabacteria bacterium]|nr:cobalamin-independent methionine synthase II family protein [Candidatus Doudnabacteria bacterium]